MKLTPRTVGLLLLTALLLVINAIDLRAPTAVSDVPVLPAVVREAVTRIELSGAEDKLTLRQADGRWKITAPYKADADPLAVRALLTSFRKEIAVDALVDTGNDDKYGLQPGSGVVAEIWTTGEEPVLSITVGNDTAGGSTFIRLSGSQSIYRARIGGRDRFALPPAEWRNKAVVDLDPGQITGITVREGAQTVALVRSAQSGDASTGAWALDPAPPWAVDQAAATQLAAVLARLRATSVVGQDVLTGATLAAQIDLTLADTTTRALQLRRGADGTLLALLDGTSDVFRVPDALLTVLPSSPAAMRDRTLLRFNRSDVDTVSLADPSGEVIVRQDPSTRLYAVVSPPNMDLDVQGVIAAVSALSSLRGDAEAPGVTPVAAGLDRPAMRLVLTFVDGSSTALEVGGTVNDAAGKPARYVRRGGSADIFLLSADTVTRLRAAFGRG